MNAERVAFGDFLKRLGLKLEVDDIEDDVDYALPGRRAKKLFGDLANIHSAALAFLNEYEKYREDDSVSFVPNREVLDAFRKAVKG